jgi:hypothetical protein
MAARSHLTPDLRERVERDLERGMTQPVVAQRAGVAPRTLAYWLASGKIVRRPAPPPPKSESPPELPLAQRLEQAEPGLVAAIIAAAQRGSWQAAAWLLERSFPDRWARRDPGTPVPQQDRFSEVDELAARRLDLMSTRRGP